MEKAWLKKSVPESIDALISASPCGWRQITTSKVKRNEDKIRLLRLLDKSGNVRYRCFIATELIQTLLLPSVWVEN